MPGEGVVEVPALAAAPEARQVDRDPAAELERTEPVKRRGRQAVQVEDRHGVTCAFQAGIARAPQEDGLVVELDRLLGNRRHAPGR